MNEIYMHAVICGDLRFVDCVGVEEMRAVLAAGHGAGDVRRPNDSAAE